MAIYVDDSGLNTLDKYAYPHHISEDDMQMHEINTVVRALCEIEVQQTIYGMEDMKCKSLFLSHERSSKLTAEGLAENWCIGLMKAQSTLRTTTQHFKGSGILPISRRYGADRFYEVKRLNGNFSADTIWATVKFLNQYKYAQVITHKCGFSAVYPINNMTGDSIGQSLIDFIHDFGIPRHMIFDGHKTQIKYGSLFMRTVSKYHIEFHVSEPRKPYL